MTSTPFLFETGKGKFIKNLVGTLKETHARHREYLSEEHIIRNLVPFIDATMDLPGSRPYRVDWGENTLHACSERRNQNRDPQLRSRLGMKCDCRMVCTTASWKAEIGVGEVSWRIAGVWSRKIVARQKSSWRSNSGTCLSTFIVRRASRYRCLVGSGKDSNSRSMPCHLSWDFSTSNSSMKQTYQVARMISPS
ncbi:hypothetical protein BC938DRAFT_480348 [Jimgerdemannia flammicorona]|uniref:Uncharacterized protein n=1 Tax=Jimgerdemannia flammicorona TaxID=994334 RepID=A0A433QIQ4_9FUNG|nr:hypothetical protein BC938DRAFT_480348 [Jimgerdemannia flammicorona]